MRKLLILFLLCWIVSVPATAGDISNHLDRSQTVSFDGDSCYIAEDGTLWGWGDNSYGQLGNDGIGDIVWWFLQVQQTWQSYPVVIAQQVAAVSSGSYYTLFLKEDGTLWSCGCGTYGSIGTGGTKDQLNPKKIMDDVVSIEAGNDVSFAIKKDGSLWGWGNNTLAAVGCGKIGAEFQAVLSPVKILDNVFSVSTDGWHTLAVKKDGTLWAWGMNGDYYNRGILGTVSGTELLYENGRSSGVFVTTPVKIMSGVVSAAAGGWDDMSSFAIKSDGSLWAWGPAQNKCLGFSSKERWIAPPTKILDHVASVNTSPCSCSAITEDGSLYAWGYFLDNNGTYISSRKEAPDSNRWILLDPSAELESKNMVYLPYYATPTKLMSNVVCGSVDQGCSHILKSDGSLWKWGEDSYGTNGVKFETHLTPVQVASGIRIPESNALNAKPTVPGLPFTDLGDSPWYQKELIWAYGKSLIHGVGSTTFGPDRSTTRGMIATMLYRLSGDVNTTQSTFPDVPIDSAYAAAVAWAESQGITGGYADGDFGPNNTITREQLVTFLYRYAKAQGRDVSKKADLTLYSDASEINHFATGAMSWSVANGILQGSDDKLLPQGAATRAQVTVMLYRLNNLMDS